MCQGRAAEASRRRCSACTVYPLSESGSRRRPALAQALAVTIFAEVDRVFAQAGIRVLPVKGVVTGLQLYEDPSHREIRDIDVRISPGDFPNAVRVAERQGWALRNVFRAYQTFTATVGGLDVDLEANCGPPGFSGLRVEDLLRRAEVGPVAALPRVPELHDHALLLVVNVVKDHLVDTTPAALEDLRRIASLPRFSPARFYGLARDAESLFMVHLVARFLAGEGGAWRRIDVDLSQAHPLRSRVVDAWLALMRRRRAASLAVRVATRLAPDGWRRPVWALARAGLYELEAARARSSSQSRQRRTPGDVSW